MQWRLPAGVGGSLARLKCPVRDAETLQRHRDRVRGAGPSRVRDALGDPHPVLEGSARCVNFRLGGTPCARIPAPLLTSMPRLAPQPPTATALPPLRIGPCPQRAVGLLSQKLAVGQRNIVVLSHGNKGHIRVITRRATQTTQAGERHPGDEQYNRDVTPCMPYTARPGERRCSEPSPLVNTESRLPARYRCCPLLSPGSCPIHAPGNSGL
jgi:hypothetical protein